MKNVKSIILFLCTFCCQIYAQSKNEQPIDVFLRMGYLSADVLENARESHTLESYQDLKAVLDSLEKNRIGGVLPSLVLFTISLSGLQRQMRANMLDVLDSDYVKFARAKGLSENKVIFKHALRNAINPLITLLGFEFAGLLSGAALTEYVFQYPGLGRLLLEAVMKSDINLVMASLMIGTIMLILGNLIADILLQITDPRLRKAQR